MKTELQSAQSVQGVKSEQNAQSKNIKDGKSTEKKRFNTRKLTVIALLAAVSSAIMYLEMPLPFMPPFLQLDLSSLPVMIGSFMFGPLAGLAIAGVKFALHLLTTQTAGVGELADFFMTSSFALTGGIIYKYNKTMKGAFIASAASIVSLTVVGALTNYFLLIPFFVTAFNMPLETIIATSNKLNPFITDLKTLIIFGVTPFNLIKGIVIAVLTFMLYKRLSIVISKYTKS